MTNTLQHMTIRAGDTVFAASRQMWLAGLGAAAVTRDWAEKEASNVLRTLIREGSAMEARAIRFVGDRVDSSVTRASALWNRTRATVESAVRNYADTAVTLVRHALPKAEHRSSSKPVARAKVKTAPARSRRTVKVAKRRVKKAVKR